jgi:starch-binding outer membrane protein, SusD/RagB family
MRRITIKITGIVFLVCTFIYLACNKKALNIPPPTQSESSFFTSESEFRTAIIGAYSSLTDFYSSANSGSGGSAVLELWFLPGDDLSQNGSQSYEFFNGLNSSDGKLNQFFKSAYVMIGRANKVLQKIATVKDGVYTTPNLKKYNEGEMLFLRGFAHFMLWNLFGTAPVDTVVVESTEQFNPPSSSGTQLLDQAIADFTRAAELLPTTAWDAKNAGRVTANAAYGMLGKTLVFRASATKNAADYQASITAFDKISGASLVTDFGDNFSADHENGSESLFEFQAGYNISGSQNPWLANDACDCGVAGAYYQMFYDGAATYMSDGRYLPTNKLKTIFEAGDPRFDYTLSADSSQIVKYVVNGDVTDGGVVSLNNHRILRLADVILLKAEAILQSGGSTAEAIGLVNQIRTRARAMGGGSAPADQNAAETDKNVIMQWIMDERLRELAAEGHRWFDMRRWNMAGYITLDNNSFSSEVPSRMTYDQHFLYFPIPDGETSKNPNIVQNQGY